MVYPTSSKNVTRKPYLTARPSPFESAPTTKAASNQGVTEFTRLDQGESKCVCRNEVSAPIASPTSDTTANRTVRFAPFHREVFTSLFTYDHSSRSKCHCRSP